LSDESMEDIAYVNKMSPVEYYETVRLFMTKIFLTVILGIANSIKSTTALF